MCRHRNVVISTRRDGLTGYSKSKGRKGTCPAKWGQKRLSEAGGIEQNGEGSG